MHEPGWLNPSLCVSHGDKAWGHRASPGHREPPLVFTDNLHTPGLPRVKASMPPSIFIITQGTDNVGYSGQTVVCLVPFESNQCHHEWGISKVSATCPCMPTGNELKVSD